MKWDEKKGVTLFKQDVKTLQRAAELLAMLRRLESGNKMSDVADTGFVALKEVLTLSETTDDAEE